MAQLPCASKPSGDTRRRVMRHPPVSGQTPAPGHRSRRRARRLALPGVGARNQRVLGDHARKHPLALFRRYDTVVATITPFTPMATTHTFGGASSERSSERIAAPVTSSLRASNQFSVLGHSPSSFALPSPLSLVLALEGRYSNSPTNDVVRPEIQARHESAGVSAQALGPPTAAHSSLYANAVQLR